MKTVWYEKARFSEIRNCCWCTRLTASLCDHMLMYVSQFVHSAVVFHVFVFKNVFMFYVGLLIMRLCSMSDTVLFIN